MEQSHPTKLPFIALLMYFYVHVNTRANNGRCEWIYFSLVGKNMPPHDRNHWHNSQLPLFSTNLAANSNMPRCRRRDILHKCERRRESDVWEGVRRLPPLVSRRNGKARPWISAFRCPVLCAAALVTALSREIKWKCVSWKRQKGNRGQSWERNGVALQLRFLFVFLENDRPSDFIPRSRIFSGSIEASVLWPLKGSVEAYWQILLLDDIWQEEFLPNFNTHVSVWRSTAALIFSTMFTRLWDVYSFSSSFSASRSL